MRPARGLVLQDITVRPDRIVWPGRDCALHVQQDATAWEAQQTRPAPGLAMLANTVLAAVRAARALHHVCQGCSALEVLRNVLAARLDALATRVHLLVSTAPPFALLARIVALVAPYRRCVPPAGLEGMWV